LSTQDLQNLQTANVVIVHTFSNGKSIKFKNIAGDAAFYDSDIAITTTKNLPQYIRIVESKIADDKSGVQVQGIGLDRNGCSLWIIFCATPTATFLWTVPVIPYIFDAGVTAEEQRRINESADRYNLISGLRMKWQKRSIYTGVDANVVFKAVNVGANGYGGLATLGYQSRAYGIFAVNFININRDSNNGVYANFVDSVIHHEMGHVAGVPHEQTRCDRDNYITFVGTYYEDKNCNTAFTTYNTPFDFSSIMLYDYRSVSPKRNASGTYIGSSGYAGNPNIAIDNRAVSYFDLNTINSIYVGR
jgi:Astacin (Peptidase family M12A)